MRIMSRSFTSAAVMYALAAPSASAQAPARPNYSGTWVMDLTKSESSTGSMPTGATWIIAQHGDTVIADRETTVAEMGTVKSHVVVGIDGKAWKNTVAQPGLGEIETSTVASWDNGTLLLVASGNIQGTDFTQTDRWSLSADGKTLVSRRSVMAGGQEVQSSTLTFTKK
jgi:hypothetical protein